MKTKIKMRKLTLHRAGKVTEEISYSFKNRYWGCNFFSNIEPECKNKSGMRLNILYNKKEYPTKNKLPKKIKIEFLLNSDKIKGEKNEIRI